MPSSGCSTPSGLVGDWSARDLIAHLGYWAGHAAEVIHAVEQGRIAEVGAGEPPVDDVNATVARVSRSTELATVRKREAASVEALVERLLLLDPALLDERLPDGATLAEGIHEDSAEHYREHADDLRAVLEERPRG
jgi:mycothiol maleylpyruvate isomerase-like protein